MAKHRLSYSEQLQDIYSKIPSINCKRMCKDACGVIPIERMELKKIRKKTDVDVESFLIPGPDGVTMLFDAERERCPLLGTDGGCTVYDVRPFICRLFGVVEGMLCHHGCRPERVLSHQEAEVLVRQLRSLK